MTAPSISSLIKVGMTTKNPSLGINSDALNRTEAQVRFTVKYASWFQDAKLAAEKAHKALRNFHYFKEFFRTDIETGINQIENLGLWYSRITSVDPSHPKLPLPSSPPQEQLIFFDQFEPNRVFAS